MLHVTRSHPRFSLVFATALLLALVACPATDGDDGDDDDDGGEGEEGEGEEGEGEEGEGEEGEGEEGEGEGEGEGEAARSFPCADDSDPVDSDASCAIDGDCAIGTLLIDCCGSEAATGVNAATLAAFTDDADGCFEAICDCASQPTVADDGTSDIGGILQVSCRDGVCTTTYFLE